MVIATLAPFPIQALPRGATIPPRSGPRWFENAWRCAVIDMHIPDRDPKFLSKFDADRYVEALVRSRAQSMVCHTHSHVGLFNYPTQIGQQHDGLKGRDFVAEMIERCHRRDIAVVVYTSPRASGGGPPKPRPGWRSTQTRPTSVDLLPPAQAPPGKKATRIGHLR